jgi:hypothetical protein
MTFYEPLHEALGGVTLESLPEISVESWDSRHPRTRPYFEEFAPLLQRRKRGVAGYDRSFAFERFFTAPDEPSHKLFAYIGSLLSLAHDSGKVPVLKFCRSLGRVGWMRNHFPQAAHIAVVRDPLSQWASACRLASSGNRYFLAAPLAILAYNDANPLIAATLTSLELRMSGLKQKTFERTYAECESFVATATLQTLYRAFVAFWLVTGFSALPYADGTIDSDLLGTSPIYRKQLQRELVGMSGIDIDLGAARVVPAGQARYEIRRSDVERIHADALIAQDTLSMLVAGPGVDPAASVIQRKLELLCDGPNQKDDADGRNERTAKNLAISFEGSQAQAL